MTTVAGNIAERREPPRVQRDADGRRLYTPDGLELTRFYANRSPMAIIRGPWGSGKSLACIQRIWQHLVEQHEDDEGYRKSRWFIYRESYPKIDTTILATWLEWFPESTSTRQGYGKLFTGTRPFVHEIRVGNIVADIYFGALDDAASDAVFKSLEPTGVYFNELEYHSMHHFFTAHGRVGRYPPVIRGGSKWSGSIADMNAPAEGHWVPYMTGEVALPDDMSLDERHAFEPPADLAYFVQPPAVFPQRGGDGKIIGWTVNSDAENLRWLADMSNPDYPEPVPGQNYYLRAMQGKTIRWIRANLGNEIIPQVDGDAVYQNFDPDVHVSKVPLEPVRGLDVSIGLDFGRRPAAVFRQLVNGQWQVQFDAAMENAGANRFAPLIREILAKHYPWCVVGSSSVRCWGDPKGQDGTQTDDSTAYDVFRGHGLIVRPAPVKQNNINTRIEAVEYRLGQLVMGRPGLLISPRASRLKMAYSGGYHYAKDRATPMTDRKPVKNKYSDVADADQYLELGEGGGREMVGKPNDRPKPVSTVPGGGAAGRSYRRNQR